MVVQRNKCAKQIAIFLIIVIMNGYNIDVARSLGQKVDSTSIATRKMSSSPVTLQKNEFYQTQMNSGIPQNARLTGRKESVLKQTQSPNDTSFNNNKNKARGWTGHVIDSQYCRLMETCEDPRALNEHVSNRNCYCDSLCSTLNDCCSNFEPETSFKTVKKNQLSCLLSDSIKSEEGEGVYMVTKCSEKWESDIIRSFCEIANDDLLLKTPVTDKRESGLTYRNMYCAQCNFVYDFVYWKTDVQCNAQNVLSGCKLKHEVPENVFLRKCKAKEYITSVCWNNKPKDLIHNCTNGPFSLVYTTSGVVYRNRYCAICNGYQEENMYCKMPEFITASPSPFTFSTTWNVNFPTTFFPPNSQTSRGPVYSFRLLVDFNAASYSNKCEDSELFDSMSKTCRQIYCAKPLVARKGVCVMDVISQTTVQSENSSTESYNNCTYVKLNSDEYNFLNESHLLLLSRQVIVKSDDFRILDSDVFICIDNLEKCISDCKVLSFVFRYAAGESYISLVGLIVSIASLSLTFLVYVCFPQLLNIPGKNLTCLVISLLSANVLFLVSSKAESVQILCKLVAVLLHYLFLAAFCWMNIIAFDFCTTFSNNFASAGRDKNLKRFILYSMYGWLTPLIFVSVALTLDLSELDSKYSSLKPGYGNGICWITSSKSLMLFFAGPLALLKLFDFIAFTLTMMYISRAKRQGANATKSNNACSFFINLKLSLIMGLTWIFAFVANIVKDRSFWYLFIAFNSLQGLFIAVCFLSSRRVVSLLTDKYKKVTSHLANFAFSTKSKSQ